MHKLSPKDRVQKAKIRLLREHPFFGYCIAQIPVVAKDERKPRGPKIVYNPEFVAALSDDELVAVLTHELLHYLLGHTARTKALKKKMAESLSEKERKAFHFKMNLAEDIVINAILVINGFRLPRTTVVVNGDKLAVRQGGIVPDVIYADRGATTIITLKDAEGKSFEVREPHTKSCEEVFFELRDFAVREGEEEKQDTMYFQDDSGEDGEGEGEGGEEGKAGAEGAESTKPGVKPPEELLSEAYNYSKIAGKTPLGIDRAIGELSKPKVNLIPFLRQFVTRSIPSDYTYLKPAKNSPPDIFLPSVEMGERVEGIVAIDTSGSMSAEDITQAISEIANVARSMSVKLTIVQCDADVHVIKDVESVRELLKMPVKGGGGTDFRPVFELAEKKRARFVVFFTDGYGTFPEKCRIPTLWVLTPRGIPESSVPFGKAIKML